MNLNASFIGFREIQAKIQRHFETVARQAVAAGCEAAVTVARMTAPSRNGWLRSSIRTTELTITPKRVTAIVKAAEKYAWFVERGTKAHIIRPKAPYNAKTVLPGQTRRARGKGPHEYIVGRGRALRWKDAGGGEHFAAIVHHPGTPPQPFMSPARAAAYWAMMQVVRRLFR